jgi:hypothetical protein
MTVKGDVTVSSGKRFFTRIDSVFVSPDERIKLHPILPTTNSRRQANRIIRFAQRTFGGEGFGAAEIF